MVYYIKMISVNYIPNGSYVSVVGTIASIV